MTYMTCVDIEGNYHTAHINDLNWRPSVYGVLLKEGQVLLSKQYGKFGLPGGGMEFGESPEEALAREIKEETGLAITTSQLQSVQSDLFKLPHLDKKVSEFVQSIQLFYICDFLDGDLSTDGFDDHEQHFAEMAEWLPIAELETIPMYGSCDFRKEIQKAASTL